MWALILEYQFAFCNKNISKSLLNWEITQDDIFTTSVEINENDFDKIDSLDTISNFVKSLTNVNSNTRGKNLNYRVTYNIITLLYVYDKIVTSKAARQHRYDELKDLFDNRAVRHQDYFKSNSKLVGIYKFIQKVIDNLVVW